MTSVQVGPHKSSIGNLDANIVALLVYLAGGILAGIPIIGWVLWLAPLVVFILEKQSSFVRFHALQALLLCAVYFVVVTLIGGILVSVTQVRIGFGWGSVPSTASIAIGWIFFIISIGLWALEIYALYNAYMYKMFKIPFIGNLAEKYSNTKIG